MGVNKSFMGWDPLGYKVLKTRQGRREQGQLHTSDVLWRKNLTKTQHQASLTTNSLVTFKRHSWPVVSTENVKIQYFFKKIFNSYIYVSVDNDIINNFWKIFYLWSL